MLLRTRVCQRGSKRALPVPLKATKRDIGSWSENKCRACDRKREIEREREREVM